MCWDVRVESACLFWKRSLHTLKTRAYDVIFFEYFAYIEVHIKHNESSEIKSIL